MKIAERLRRTYDRVRTEPGLGRNVIVFGVLIALAGVTGVVILANQRVNWPWQERFDFYASFEDTPGVSANHGQEVRIAGISVGQIGSATVDDDGHARLRLSIEPQYKVYDNATVVLRPKSPLNEMYVELNPGGTPGHRLPSGGHLAITNSQRPIQVDEVFGHLDGDARRALSSLLAESDAALVNADQYLPRSLNATDALARQLTPVVDALSTRRAAIQRLVTALQQISSAVGGDDRRLSRLATSLQRTLGAVGEGRSALNATLRQVPDLTTQLRDATDAVQELSAQLDPTLDSLKDASRALPQALSRVTRTVDQAGDTIDQLQPVLTAAVPVVRDLRPLTTDLVQALPDLRSITQRADPVTAAAIKYLPDLGAFTLNTRSVTSLRDANGGILRGLLEITPSTIPAGLLPSLNGRH
jgi:phospholipid/cholesterol/gamma-HCH transport system substrate-binding protein